MARYGISFDNEVNMIRALVFLTLLLGCSGAADAGAHDAVNGGKAVAKQTSGVSPAVEKSDKKFFGKDYPWDKRPPVDVMHFKHPYPVVQDSDDFDKDFVKDENSDDGSWKAQTEYDRLRHKLRKEKADIAKALAKKTKAEKQLREAIRRKDAAEEAARIAAEKRRREAQEAHANGQSVGEKLQRVAKDIYEAPAKIPASIASAGEVAIATDETQRAMDDLEECKKELAAARENLKKLMKELEEAKKKEQETENAVTTSDQKRKDAEAGLEKADSTVKDEYKQYLDAREAYLKQQAIVAKMEQDIKAAAVKVKAFRDKADADGGVYPTPTKSGAPSSVSLLSTGLVVSLAYVARWVC